MARPEGSSSLGSYLKINEITQPFLRRNFLAHLFGNGVGTFEKVVGTLQTCLPQHCQLRLKHFHLHYVNLTFVLVDVRVQLHVMAYMVLQGFRIDYVP